MPHTQPAPLRTARPWNFSAGPATMPDEVLQQAAAEMLDWNGSGMGVMEMSHRGPEFVSICARAEADLRTLLAIPPQFKVLFMQGGGVGQNAIVPLNLSRAGTVDFVVSGAWSAKSAREAEKYAAEVRIAASGREGGFVSLPAPSSWQLGRGASYVHICSNETIHGVAFHEWPDLRALGSDAPLVVDFSSDVASCPVDWTRVGLAFAGAQKNLGPAGVTLVVVREDLLGHALGICPSAFDYRNVTEHQSMYNTPPTWGIYMAGLMFQWLLRQREGKDGVELRGVHAMQARNAAKAELLYQYIDQSELYFNKVAAHCRSHMNVPFFLRDEGRNAAFLAGAAQRGLLQLKGHKSVGGMRASLYNAMPLAGVQALVDYMRAFEQGAP